MSKMKIVFMGTPEFAVASLNILVANDFDVVCVVTATDKLGGRGNKQLIESAVKQYAVQKNIPVLQPEKLKNPEFVEILRGYDADLFVVVAFRMLPEMIWTMPRLGTMNLHGSLLPRYRGAAPINWAVINGEKETGVTTFFLKHEIDTGDVLMTDRFAIEDDDTAGEVHDKMMRVGAETLLKSVKMIEKGGYILKPQEDTEATHAPKIFTETCVINFNQSTQKVHDFIRGLSPYPTAFTTLDNLKLKIFKTKKEVISPQSDDQNNTILVAKFVSDNKSFVKIATEDGFIHLIDVQLEGRKRMDIKSFLNGYKILEL
jgi:methionyl-tRNA formyltransferase